MTTNAHAITDAQLDALSVIFGATIQCQEDGSLMVVDGDFVSLVCPDGQIRQEDAALSRGSNE